MATPSKLHFDLVDVQCLALRFVFVAISKDRLSLTNLTPDLNVLHNKLRNSRPRRLDARFYITERVSERASASPRAASFVHAQSKREPHCTSACLVMVRLF